MRPAPAVSAAEAERIARERFGIDARATPLAGEIDLNFALDGAAGRHVLKLYAPGTDPEPLELQDAALALLAGDPAVPRLHAPARAVEGGRLARVLGWLPGTPWAELGEHPPAALASLGRTVARVDRALAGFDHPALPGRLRWNMLAAGDLAGDASGEAAAVLARFTTEVLPRLRALPPQAIHNDANEHNVLVGDGGEVCGLIDFGDLCSAPRACGLAVACAYARRRCRRPSARLAAARRRLPRGRAAHAGGARAAAGPDPHAAGDERRDGGAPAPRAARQRLPADQPGGGPGAAAPARPGARPSSSSCACARPAATRPCRTHARCARFLGRREAGPVCERPLRDAPVLDWSGDAPEPPASTPALGRYLEQRRVYDTDAFATELPGERRTLHLGVDVFLDAGEPILAPLDGVVRDSAHRPAARDFGGVVLLDHRTAAGEHLPHALRAPRPRAAAARDARRARRADRARRQRRGERRLGAAPAPPAADHRPGRRLRRARRRHARRARPVGVGQPRSEPPARHPRRRPRRAVARLGRRAGRAPHARCRARSASPTRSRCGSCAAPAPTSTTSTARSTSTSSTTSATSATRTRASCAPPPSRWRA